MQHETRKAEPNCLGTWSNLWVFQRSRMQAYIILAQSAGRGPRPKLIRHPPTGGRTRGGVYGGEGGQEMNADTMQRTIQTLQSGKGTGFTLAGLRNNAECEQVRDDRSKVRLQASKTQECNGAATHASHATKAPLHTSWLFHPNSMSPCTP